jgi:hypothetical protein
LALSSASKLFTAWNSTVVVPWRITRFSAGISIVVLAAVQAWSERDPTASQYIPAVELSSLLRELPPPMGVRGEEGEQAKIQSIIMSVDIPIRKKNKVRQVGPR